MAIHCRAAKNSLRGTPVHMIGSFIGRFVRLVVCRCKRSLAALVSLVQIILFLTIPYFTLFVLTAQQAGQAVVPGLSLKMYCISDRAARTVMQYMFLQGVEGTPRVPPPAPPSYCPAIVVRKG